jgi:hypothetical protein
MDTPNRAGTIGRSLESVRGRCIFAALDAASAPSMTDIRRSQCDADHRSAQVGVPLTSSSVPLRFDAAGRCTALAGSSGQALQLVKNKNG